MANLSATMTEQEAIERHLFEDCIIEGTRVYHGFGGILEDARRVTGRNLDTGQVVDPVRAGSWIGAIGYLTLLDQIGACFKDRNQKLIEGKNDIYKALSYFSDLNDKEIWAIYALRCAFAHDYSLYNIKRGRPERTHWFAVSAGTNTLVELPDKPWEGDYHHKDPQCQTKIDLQKLGDKVEEIVQKLLEKSRKNQLEIVLGGGKDELHARYTYSACTVVSMTI